MRKAKKRSRHAPEGSGIPDISSVSTTHFEAGIYQLPPSRVIGKAFVHLPGEEGHRQFVKALFELLDSDTWKKTIKTLPMLVPNTGWGFTCEYVAETDSFTYLQSVLTPEGTPVPDGLDCRDVPSTLVWASPRGGPRFADAIRDRPELSGYVENFDAPSFPWQAEVHFDDEAEKYPGDRWEHWFSPIRRKGQ